MTETPRDADAFAGVRRIVDGAGAGQVFGPPITQDGTMVLPVARVSGGGGGGNGGDGTGAGAGLVARPVGVYVLRGGEVTWSPAVDVTRIVLGGQLVAVAGMLLVRALLRHRSTTRGRRRGQRIRRLR